MRGHRRSGITLTEILIAIMIMGVGLVSLATLFPIGLLRLRDAARYSRSTYLGQSAAADLSSRSLLLNFSFLNTGYYDSSISGYYNPFLQDTPYPGGDWAGASATTATSPGAYSGPGGVGLSGSSQSVAAANGSGTAVYPNLNGPGLPFCYDPLWRYQTINESGVQGYYPDLYNPSTGKTTINSTYEARFGVGDRLHPRRHIRQSSQRSRPAADHEFHRQHHDRDPEHLRFARRRGLARAGQSGLLHGLQ